MRTKTGWLNGIVLAIIVLALPATALAQDIGTPDPDVVKGLYPGKAYSPYAQRSFPNQVFWGDTHLHTGLSLDAGLFGCTLGPEDAYRLARGEEIKSSRGMPVKLSRPLDWLVVTDHSDMMGIATDIQSGAPNVLAVPKGKEWHEGFQKGGEAAGEAAFDLITHFAQMIVPKKLLEDYSPGSPIYDKVWDEIIEAADSYYEPGRFTALIGYEWTSVPKGFNLHRNVILRDDGDRARENGDSRSPPSRPRGRPGPARPLQVAGGLRRKNRRPGSSPSAHNGNLSNGWMFPTEKTYAMAAMVNEELRESSAPSGSRNTRSPRSRATGKRIRLLSPNDEFADFETWDVRATST